MITSEDYWRMVVPETEGRDIEDCPDCVFAINLMRWFISEVVGLFRSPVQLIVFYLIILWPELLSVDIGIVMK